MRIQAVVNAKTVAGVGLSHVYQRTNIPLAQVPSPYQGQIRATVPATSRASALAILAHVRKQYQACQAAYRAEGNYQANLDRYNAAKAAYRKKWHNLKVQRTSNGEVIARPPKFTKIQPTTPAGCPGPVITPPTGPSP